ncbi:MAG: CapA family protein [Oscillospiraceae bacterium]|nr:CapA family protein [Oscillospiraceae bacterium]
MKKLISVFIALMLALSLCACGERSIEPSPSVVEPSSLPVAAPVESEPEPEPVPEDSVVRLKAVGDNLIHDSIYKQAAQYAEGSGFDFSPMYQYVEDVIADADISYINQETIIAERLYELSGYPRFNTPEALGEHMVEIGFDVVNIANNHMFDKHEDGLAAALDFWEEQGVAVFGAWRSEEDMSSPIITEKNGISIAWVPMTEHTNGLTLPAETEMCYIITNEYDLMEEQIKLARESADFVIVVPHWGTEYSIDSNDNQEYLAQLFADWGADLVIGSHSHTLQPVEWLTGEGGNRTLVVYSLGNFIGNMLYPQNMVGGILDVDITKDGATGEVSITRAEVLPTVIHFEGLAKHIRVYPVEEYTAELAANHGMEQLDAMYEVTVTQSLTLPYIRSIIEHSVPEEFRPNLDLSTLTP